MLFSAFRPLLVDSAFRIPKFKAPFALCALLFHAHGEVVKRMLEKDQERQQYLAQRANENKAKRLARQDLAQEKKLERVTLTKRQREQTRAEKMKQQLAEKDQQLKEIKSAQENGNKPSSARETRNRRFPGRLIFNTSIVTRPIGLFPTSRAPAHEKCSGQLSRRGLNNRTIAPVIGSTPDKFVPLNLLQ